MPYSKDEPPTLGTAFRLTSEDSKFPRQKGCKGLVGKVAGYDKRAGTLFANFDADRVYVEVSYGQCEWVETAAAQTA